MRTEQGALGLWVLLGVAIIPGAGQQAPGEGEPKPSATLKGHTSGVNSMAFSPDGRTLASSSCDGTLKLWEVASGRGRLTLRGHPGVPSEVAFGAGGRTLASCGTEDGIRLWRAAGEPRGVLHVAGDLVWSFAFSPGGGNLAVSVWTDYGRPGVKGEPRLRLWDLRSGEERRPFKGCREVTVAVAFSRDGRMLVGGDTDGVVTVWEVLTGGVRMRLKSARHEINAVAFLRGSLWLASAGSDGVVRLWDLRATKQHAALKGHFGRICCLAVAGDLLASASLDATVRLWDTAARKQLLILKLDHPVWCVAFSPDSKLLAAGDEKGTIRLWSVPKLLAHKGNK